MTGVTGVPGVKGVDGAYVHPTCNTALMNRRGAIVLGQHMIGATLNDACTDIVQLRTYVYFADLVFYLFHCDC